MIPALSGAGADIAEICLRFHVRRLDLFGSAARETDFTEQSDIDWRVAREDLPPLRAAVAALLKELEGAPRDRPERRDGLRCFGPWAAASAWGLRFVDGVGQTTTRAALPRRLLTRAIRASATPRDATPQGGSRPWRSDDRTRRRPGFSRAS
jgi:hypothetical protein